MKIKHWSSLLAIGIFVNFVALATCVEVDLQQLKLIEASMDGGVDPCEDFHAYACGRWSHGNKGFHADLEELLKYNFTIRLMEEVLGKYPKNVLGEREGNQTALEKAAVFLHSCLKVKTVEVTKYLEEIKPGKGLEWPLMAESSAGNWSDFNAFELLGQLQSYGYASDILEQTTVRRNGSILTVLTIPDTADFDEVAIQKILRDLRLPADAVSHQLQELRGTHDYWQAAYRDYADFGESENLFSHNDIRQSNPELEAFLNHVLPPKLREPDSLVVIPFWDYLEFLLSQNWQSPEENQKFANYLMVKFLLHLKKSTNPICLETTLERMHLAYDYVFYENFYVPQGRAINRDLSQVNKIISKSFHWTLQENRLNMTSQQIEAMRQMLSKITLNIGNLPENLSPTTLEKFYALLPDLDINNFYANDLKLMQHRTLEPIICPATMDCNPKLATAPKYLPEQDLLVIPFASLHHPIYQANMDPLFQLSSLGFLLAHEFTHNIDPSGLITDDMYGHLFTTIMDHPNVKASIQCLKAQQPSSNEVSETIADLVAARLTYRSYLREYNRQPNFSALPWRQLFFLNLGQMLCSKPLSNNGMRLNHIAMNMAAFSRAFQCPLGSKMNPEIKCRFY